MSAQYNNMGGIWTKTNKRYANIGGTQALVNKRYVNVNGVWTPSYVGYDYQVSLLWPGSMTSDGALNLGANADTSMHDWFILYFKQAVTIPGTNSLVFYNYNYNGDIYINVYDYSSGTDSFIRNNHTSNASGTTFTISFSVAKIVTAIKIKFIKSVDPNATFLIPAGSFYVAGSPIKNIQFL